MDEQIKKDLIYWTEKLEIFTKSKDKEKIKMAEIMIDLYLDKHNSSKDKK